MTVFILNDRVVRTDISPGTTLLDFIRYHHGLKGTKIGCREGDCGACTVLEGVLSGPDRLSAVGADVSSAVVGAGQSAAMPEAAKGAMQGMAESYITYRTIVSCLTPLGNAHGKHIVTVEGLNMDMLSPVQQAFADHNGTQCGFCTPGFVVSLTGHAITAINSDSVAAIASMDGNICRCTGYKSIERAAISVSRILKDKDPSNPLSWLVAQGVVPSYFMKVPAMLQGLRDELVHTGPGKQQGKQGRMATSKESRLKETPVGPGPVILGGGTDLMVQRPDEVADSQPLFLLDRSVMRGIRRDGSQVVIGASTTAGDIMQSALMQELFPGLKGHFRLISSDPIRNMGTLAGNLVNASPIGDLSIFFLALDATLVISPGADSLHNPSKHRTIPLKDFFVGYKQLNLQPGELVCALSFPVPAPASRFNFEKVSKRTHLDIASVNTAMSLEVSEHTIKACHASCGGVAPVPLYLRQTSTFLPGKPLLAATISEAAAILQQEISPITDVRGTVAYKRLLARQLFLAHFMQLFPDRFDLRELTQNPLPS